MKKFNTITIGSSPYDVESLIKGLSNDVENAQGYVGLKKTGISITILPSQALDPFVHTNDPIYESECISSGEFYHVNENNNSFMCDLNGKQSMVLDVEG